MKKLNKIKNYSLKAAKIGKKKKVKGFTLVELIVVIAIIGVLAVVLIPNLMGQVQKSRLATANDAAAKIAEQVRIAITDLESEGRDYSSTLTCGLSTTLAADDSNALEVAVAKAVPDLQKENARVSIKIDDSNNIYVIYAENDTTPYVGLSPKPKNYEYDKEKNFDSWEIKAKTTKNDKNEDVPTGEYEIKAK